jgi:hypothetical protein
LLSNFRVSCFTLLHVSPTYFSLENIKTIYAQTRIVLLSSSSLEIPRNCPNPIEIRKLSGCEVNDFVRRKSRKTIDISY